jgi:two-component system CheB/CheR fusion protein
MMEHEVQGGEAAAPDQTGSFIAGPGASAGGLEALEAFFDHVPKDSGLALVLVTHLVPGRMSPLPEILARRCAVPLVQVDQPVQVEPKHLYIAAPGSGLVMEQGELRPSVADE